MKKRTFLAAFLIIGVLFGVGGVNAWALSAPEERATPVAAVTVDEGEAFIGTPGSWRPVTVDSVVVPGEHIRTNARSQATVNFFDGATARLDESSEVTVTQAGVDQDNHMRSVVTLQVVGGRVWSRVVKLLDPEAAFQVETTSMVATVRGTAFVVDVRDAEGDVVQVVEGAVGVAMQEKKDVADADAWQNVTAGEEAWGAKSAERRTREGMRRRATPGEMRGSAWFKKMQAADERFLQHIREQREAVLRRASAVLPGSPLYPLRRLGESVRVALTTNAADRRALAMDFATRRFAETMALGRAGKQEQSTRSWKAYLRTIWAIDQGMDADGRVRLLGRLMEARGMVAPVNGTPIDLPAFLERELSPESEFGTLVTAMVTARPVFRPALRPVLTPSAPATTTDAPAGEAMNTNINQPVINANANANTNTNLPAPTTLRLSVVATRTIMNASDTQQLRAILTLSDNSTRDVTNEATWMVLGDPPLGTVTRGFLTTTLPGLGAVQAAYQGMSASVDIRVQQLQAATLTRLLLTPANTTLAAGGQVTFRATAEYSDGSSKDVTTQAGWSLNNPQVGSMSAGTLRTTINSYGSGIVTATFSEAGQTQSANASVYVAPAG